MSTLPIDKRRRFLAVLGVAFAVEGGLYATVTPLLPRLSRDFDLSQAVAGLLLSSYAAGIVAGSLLCVLFVARMNVRSVAALALSVLAVTTMVFAWTDDAQVLLVMRLIQGIAGGVTWTACLTWLLRVWPVDRRGEAMGKALVPAVIGTVAGPAVGTIALWVGVRVTYSVVAAICLATALAVLRMPRPAARVPADPASPSRSRLLNTLVVSGAGVAALAGLMIGGVNLAGPQMLADLGAREVVAGAAFMTAAVVMIFAATPIGQAIDRYGALPTAVVSLAALVVVLPVLAAGRSTLLVAVCIVVLVASTTVGYMAAGTMLTKGSERAGGSLYIATALLATVWGLGETGGAIVAGLGFDGIGTEWTLGTGAVLTLIGLAVLAGIPAVRRRRTTRKCPELL